MAFSSPSLALRAPFRQQQHKQQPQQLSSSFTSSSSSSLLHLGKQVGEFENNGPFAWLRPYLMAMGLKEGRIVKYGGLFVDRDDAENNDENDESKAARLSAAKEAAAVQKMNIGVEERQRRQEAGRVLGVLTVVYAVVACFIDEGDLQGRFVRLGVWFPLFFANGFTLSAETGL